ncbi:HAD-IIA family hydrolase [Dermatobacter hominis]|uniref:HAD-IIA family hydrolase n=1 Tax=Dermatobacter hominis TaxID=2884263 RepID=UPI001D1060D8|nr:HAD hydrolase-like protein [Dermatobacter hominis]UDY36240.1 HAD hydrolase-like protein [Dermatobacter hominis]
MALWAIDLDGVIWRGPDPVPGSPEAVEALLARGDRVVFCTNHAMSPDSKLAHLRAMGVPDCPVVTSGDAVVSACAGAASVLVLGDPTLVAHLRSSGLPATDVRDLPDGAPAGSVDAVVVGALEDWNRSRIGMAADAIRSGARFLATNDDATYPTTGPAGPRLLPGNGALVAAVATASGRLPEVTGKPHPPMAAVIVERHGPVDVVVGDKPETDGGLAVALGARFGLVLSGVTAAEDLPVRPEPWAVADDLAALVASPL